MNSKRRSRSPVEYKEGRDKDYESSGRKDNSRDLEESSDTRLRRGHESGRHTDRHSYGTSRESKRHDDYRRYHDKHGDDYSRSHTRASRSDRESRYGEKSVNRDQRSTNEGKQSSPHRNQRNDGGEHNKYTDARKQEYRGYGGDRDHYKVTCNNKETIKEEEVLKKRNGKEIDKEALVETRQKRRSLFSSTGPNADNPRDAKPSSVTNEALDNSAATLDDGVNAAKVAAMKAAELVNRNIAAFGAGTGRLSTDQKKKLLWGNKKSNPSEETSNRWDLNLFSDRERQEKFNKLMSLRMPWWLWPNAGCEEQRPCSGERSREQRWKLSRNQEAGGTRHQPGEALHSRTPPERWQDCRPRSLGNSACKCYGIGTFGSLLCTIFSGLFILARRRLITSFIYLC